MYSKEQRQQVREVHNQLIDDTEQQIEKALEKGQWSIAFKLKKILEKMKENERLDNKRRGIKN